MEDLGRRRGQACPKLAEDYARWLIALSMCKQLHSRAEQYERNNNRGATSFDRLTNTVQSLGEDGLAKSALARAEAARSQENRIGRELLVQEFAACIYRRRYRLALLGGGRVESISSVFAKDGWRGS